MIVRTDQLVGMARVAMGCHPGDRKLIHCRDPDLLSLDRLLAAKVARAVREVYSGLDPVRAAAAARTMDHLGVYWHLSAHGFHSGHVLLPEDFGRLVTFRMSDWHIPVTTALPAGAPGYAATASPYPGISGSPWRPVCALTPVPEGLALEFHSSASAGCTIAEATYLPFPRVKSDGTVDVARDLIPDIAEAMASMVSLTSTTQSR